MSNENPITIDPIGKNKEKVENMYLDLEGAWFMVVDRVQLDEEIEILDAYWSTAKSIANNERLINLAIIYHRSDWPEGSPKNKVLYSTFPESEGFWDLGFEGMLKRALETKSFN